MTALVCARTHFEPFHVNINSAQLAQELDDAPEKSSDLSPNSKAKLDLYFVTNFHKVNEFLKNSHAWCTTGVISALPFTVKLAHNARYYLDDEQKYTVLAKFQFTTAFFKSKLGIQFADWEDQYIKSRADALTCTGAKDTFCEMQRKALETTLENDFEKGTCYGEAAAVMISNQPRRAASILQNVVLKAKKAHIIFFQAMSDLRWLHHKYLSSELTKIAAEEQKVNKELSKMNIREISGCTETVDALLKRLGVIRDLRATSLAYFKKNKMYERHMIESLAKVRFIEQIALSCSSITKHFFEEVIQRTGAQILRLTFPHKKEAHTICIFLHPRFQVYDSLAGMVNYVTQDSLLDDIMRYFDQAVQFLQANLGSTSSAKNMTIEVFQRTS